MLDGMSAVLAFSSLYFFYRGVEFLATRDYISAMLTILVGLALVRGGIDAARLGFLAGEEER
jgi:hypothetical protein